MDTTVKFMIVFLFSAFLYKLLSAPRIAKQWFLCASASLFIFHLTPDNKLNFRCGQMRSDSLSCKARMTQ